MTRLRNAYALIAAVNAPAEQKFAAALIVSAVESARAGDLEAYNWIDSPAVLRWLPAVTDDCERIRAALLATIPAPEPSVPGAFHQPLLPGLPHDISYETQKDLL